jgi:hypothetical protein
MSDKLVFDLAQEVEGTPNVFVRKDWINILDNQNQNYNNNQSVIDTSQLSNSNKYMSYREAYFSMPFLLSIATTGVVNGAGSAQATSIAAVAAPIGSLDYAIGLKNWFGQIIHSFTLDYNGTTIIQQTPYINMWNSFKLMTSLSMGDVRTQGSTIGFYPDNADTFVFSNPTAGALVGMACGQGTCNNSNLVNEVIVAGQLNNYRSGRGNRGFLERQQSINFDGEANTGASPLNTIGATYNSLLAGGAAGACRLAWKSYIQNKISYVAGVSAGVWQCAIVATIYLKHVHSFFNMCPLLKGVFMKMTINLNNSTSSIDCDSTVQVGTTTVYPSRLKCTSSSNALGGVVPFMFASGDIDQSVYDPDGPALGVVAISSLGGGDALFPTGTSAQAAGTVSTISWRANLSVGAICLDPVLATTVGIQQGVLSRSVYLYIPAYTFNPVFEQAYLSSPVKQIKYTDVYQYQVLNTGSNSMFNNLLTNGIANIKSVLLLPFYSPSAGVAQVQAGVNLNSNTGFLQGSPVWQSPFDTAGCGTTSPCCWLTNFNIQISGQNAIYNMEKYNFEQWNNQLYGQNAVNGGLTDGLTSGLIDRNAFDLLYCYYYVNVERMLPVEQSVPKSVQILGQNLSSKSIDLYCFIEYGVDISIDALTGARV